MLRREFRKIQPILIVLTLVNLALLIFTLAQMRSAVAADEAAPVLRGRALQIVDDRGRVRASINVYPASTQKDGERYAETVLLRLITAGASVGQDRRLGADRRIGSRRPIGHERDIRATGGDGHG